MPCTLIKHHLLAEAGEPSCPNCGEKPLDLAEEFNRAVAAPSPFKIGGQGRGGIVTKIAVREGMATRMEWEAKK